jgi:Secreted protein containing C-terminal beta-propeller domain distantly related to WD-40 repeats
MKYVLIYTIFVLMELFPDVSVQRDKTPNFANSERSCPFMKKTMLSLLALLLCASLCACAAPAPENSGNGAGTSSSPATAPDVTLVSGDSSNGTSGSTAVYIPQPFSLKNATDYNDIFSALNTSRNAADGGYYTGIGGKGVAVSDAAVSAPSVSTGASNSGIAAETPSAEPSAPVDSRTQETQSSDDYSGTNVQVAGIDEGDIVKTDGKYLYILDQNNAVRIVEAAGENTRQISSIKLNGDWWGAEMYVDSGVLVVLQSVSTYDEHKDGTRTAATFYDVSNPSAVKELYSLAQDGYYLTSRMTDGVLYLISQQYVYYLYDTGVTPKPREYVPCIYKNGTETVLDARCILLPPGNTDSSYTVLTSVDMKTGERLSEQAVMGNSDTVYMNGNNLYLAGTRYDQTSGGERTLDQYTVADWENANVTTITRFSLDGGILTPEATGTVPGDLLNQFSMDEEGGYLRLVTTINQYSYSIYTDEKYGFTNYMDGDSLQCNALYVLDSSLQVAGSIEDLAKDERVYSVRFDGNIGYFVTYRQMDPLFTVDLSDPAHPTILGTLKIPGFSQYLHIYGDGRLFGLGSSTTNDTDGTVDGMKLSMFDVSNPADVSEISTLKLEGDWSEAQYNHKAILVLPEKNIIAFPLSGGYAVYGYDEAHGFSERASMEVKDLMWDGLRGVQIGDLFYLCARNGVGVYSLTDFTSVAQIAF